MSPTVEQLALDYIAKWRHRLKIDPSWIITLETVPVLEANAEIVIDYSTWNAFITLWENLSIYEVENVILHEMIELLMSETLDILDCVASDSPQIQELYRHARDRQIAKLISVIDKE
jgi:hypothetical protein